jgi:hypothetical protein
MRRPSERPAGYGETFVATYRPAPRWSPEIRKHDGHRCIWQRVWIIEAGPFVGQWACIPLRYGLPASENIALAWAPESELVERE